MECIQEIGALDKLWSAAEKAFVAAYTSDPNRKGMRPGDFRYLHKSHSLATVAAGDAYRIAGDNWRAAYQAYNVELRRAGRAA